MKAQYCVGQKLGMRQPQHVLPGNQGAEHKILLTEVCPTKTMEQKSQAALDL